MNSNHRIIFLVSLLYALLTPWLLCRVASHPSALVWTTSLVSCSYFFIGTIYFSSDTTTTAILSVFFRVSCGTLLTVAATHLMGSNTGAIIFTLFTFYAAGMLGYAIGEYLQRAGFENSADIAAARPLRDEDLQKSRDECVFYICFIQGNMSLGLIVRMAWVVLFPPSRWCQRPPMMISCSSSMSSHWRPCFFPGCGPTWWLYSSWNRLLSQSIPCSASVLLATWRCIHSTFVFLIVKWNAAAMLIHWALAISMAGFFGYCLAFHARYKHIRTRYLSFHSNFHHSLVS